MANKLKIWLLAAVTVFGLGAAQAAGPTPNTNQGLVYSSFTNVGRAADLTATGSSQDEVLGFAGPVARIYNSGSVAAAVALNSAASSVTFANGTIVAPGACIYMNAVGMSHVQAITGGTSATLQISVGWGNGGDCGGAGGGGGSGGNVNLTQVAGTNLAAPTAWGTAPSGGSIVPNMNVYCVVGCSAGTVSNASSGVATSATNNGTVAYNYGFNGTTWDQLQVDANKNLKIVVNQGSGVISATNGLYTNILQGNAVLSATNGTYSNLLQGNAALSATNGLYSNILLANVAPATGAGATGSTVLRVGVAQDTTTIAGSAPGTAGTPSANAVTVQGAAGATPIVTSTDVAVYVAPTIQNAAYASGNAVGALQSVSVFRTTNQPSGVLNALLLAWKGTETTPLTFFVFDTNPTGSTCTDKTAFSLATADIPKLALAPFTLTAAAPAVGTTSTYAQSSFSPVSVKNQDSGATQNLYICAVSGGSFTPAVGDLTYKVSVVND
jgi:hypothetical protein